MRGVRVEQRSVKHAGVVVQAAVVCSTAQVVLLGVHGCQGGSGEQLWGGWMGRKIIFVAGCGQ